MSGHLPIHQRHAVSCPAPFDCRRMAARVRVGVGSRLDFLNHFGKMVPSAWHTSTSSEGLRTFEVATSFASDLWLQSPSYLLFYHMVFWYHVTL